jgi:hypothetical protein
MAHVAHLLSTLIHHISLLNKQQAVHIYMPYVSKQPLISPTAPLHGLCQAMHALTVDTAKVVAAQHP